MAFLQKTWKDRVAEYINRRVLTKEDGTTELVSVERSEGTISQEGDAFSAANMNDLEQRIANEFSEQNKKSVIYNPDDDYLYINGVKWKKANLYNLILYSYGDEYSDVTGGWSNINNRSQVLTKNIDNIYAPSGSVWGGIGTTRLIDLAEYSTLKVNANVTGKYDNEGLYISLLNGNKSTVAEFKMNTIGLKDWSFDVSSYNGKYYIEIIRPAASENTGYIYDIRLT